MKKYLMMAVASLAFASCNKMDVSGPQRASDAETFSNAEKALGVTIDPNQSWNMTQEVVANIPVNGFYGAKYVVTIYDQNPLTGNAVTVLGRTTVTSGQTANFKFTAPKGLVGVFAAIKDEKGYTYTKPAVIADGMVETAFGGGNAASAPSFTRAATVTRGAADDFTIPTREMPNLSAYIDDAVAIDDANNVTYGGGVEHYLIPEGTTWSKNIPLIQSGSGISVYVQGTLNINAEQRVNGGCVFIVGPKGTVNIASGQQLVTNANNNAGTVGSFYVYPGGKVQGEGTLQFANGTGSYNYNGGTIDVGTINNNGGTLYNAGIIEADHMLGGAGLSIYENAGKVHIGEAPQGSTTANTRIHNNCWWECDGTLACRNIRQGAGAYIKAANLEMSGSADGTGDAAYIWAKENSLIDVPGSAAFNNVDIVGPTAANNWAYIQLGKIVNSNGHGYQDTALKTATNYTTSWDGGLHMSVGAIQNNIRISCDNPETDTNMYASSAYELVLDMLNGERAYTAGQADPSWSDWRALPIQGNGNAEIVAKGQVDEVKSESECSPGVVPVPPIIIEEEYPIYSYAFEDTRLGDYDMNDVVIKAQEVEVNNVKKINLKLVASGASLDLNIRLYEAATPDAGKAAKYQGDFTVLEYQGNNEVHAMLGVAKATLVNTGGAKADPITIQIDKGSYDPAHLPLAIYSEKEGEMRLAGSGEAPFGVIIPIDWKWPRERVNITTAYNATESDEGDQSFAKFASEAGQALNWFNYPTGSVMIIQ